MALKPVTDPNILAALGAPTLPAQPSAPVATGPTPVADPALLAQLNAPEKPALAPGETEMNRAVPGPADMPSAPITAPAEPSIWEKFMNNFQNGDPVASMIGHGVSTIAQGAPEVAAGAVNNAAAQGVAGLTGSTIADPNDSANFIRDFIESHSHEPQGENAKALSAGLGEAFGEPISNLKRGLGDAALSATGSPLAAAGADLLPDLGAALVGGPKAGTSEIAEAPVFGASAKPNNAMQFRQPERPAEIAPGEDLSGGVKPQPAPVNPKVADLRAADIRMRPSDVRAMTPGAKSIPGEFREKFASGPALKNDMTLHNQQRMTDIAAKDIGVKKLDDASLDAAEKPAAATYDTVENVLRDRDMSPEFVKTFQEGLDSIKLELPRGKPYSVTGVLGAIRRRGAKRLQSDNPEMEAKGYADRNMADAIEEGLGNELKNAGEPQLLDEYQNARQLFAKVNDVRSATRAGQIDANVVYKLGKRGVPLSGGLKLVADAAEHAPNVTGHSLKTAARAGEEVPNSREGVITRGTKALIRKIPGMDVGAPGFQEKFGPADEARTSYYGQDNSVAPARGPEQKGLDLREALNLEAPPGEVGAPQRAPRPIGPQMDALGNEFELQATPGEVGIPPEAPISLQDLLGLGEPLNLEKAPGRIGKPKRKA